MECRNHDTTHSWFSYCCHSLRTGKTRSATYSTYASSAINTYSVQHHLYYRSTGSCRRLSVTNLSCALPYSFLGVTSAVDNINRSLRVLASLPNTIRPQPNSLSQYTPCWYYWYSSVYSCSTRTAVAVHALLPWLAETYQLRTYDNGNAKFESFLRKLLL